MGEEIFAEVSALLWRSIPRIDRNERFESMESRIPISFSIR